MVDLGNQFVSAVNCPIGIITCDEDGLCREDRREPQDPQYRASLTKEKLVADFFSRFFSCDPKAAVER